MAIRLPSAAPASSGSSRPRGIGLPGPANVQTVNPAITRDPGLRVSPEQFGAAEGRALERGARRAEGLAVDLENTAARMAAADERVRSRRDAVERARAERAFIEAAGEEKRRLDTEGDWSTDETLDGYGAFLEDLRSKLEAGHGSGSEQSNLLLQEKLLTLGSVFRDNAAAESAKAQRKLVTQTLNEDLSSLTQEALENPGAIEMLVESWDARIDNMAPALSPDEEIALQDAGREQIAISSVQSFLKRGAWQEAQEVIASSPGLIRALTPEAQRDIMGRIDAFASRENEGRGDAQRKLEEFRALNRRDPTPAERLALTFGGQPEGPAEPQSDIGKLAADRPLVVRIYGEGSPQLEALDEAVASFDEGEGVKTSDVAGLRKEFTKLSEPYILVRSAFEKVRAAVEFTEANPGAPGAGDVALVFGFMKLVDHGSTVREGEFATAEQTAGVPTRIVTLYNSLLAGDRLSPEQRRGFLNQAELLFRVHENTQARLEEQFGSIATSQGMNRDEVIVNFRGGQPPGGISSVPETTSEGRPVFDVDLQGNIIRGGEPEPPAPSPEPAPPALSPDPEQRSDLSGQGGQGDVEGAVASDVDPRRSALSQLLAFASADELQQLTEKAGGELGEMAAAELGGRTAEEAQEFLALLDIDMIKPGTQPGLLRRTQEALKALGHDTPTDGKYRKALVEMVKSVKAGTA